MNNELIHISKTSNFNVGDLGSFLSSYGKNISDGGFPVSFLAAGNYFQDISTGGSFLGNLTTINGESIFENSETPEFPIDDFVFGWSLDGTLYTNKPQPRINDMIPPCDGVMTLKIETLHKPTQVVATREMPCYHGWNNITDCPIKPPPAPQSPFQVFVPFFPDIDPVEAFHSLRWDFDKSGSVTVKDLNYFLTNFGVEEFKAKRALLKSRSKVNRPNALVEMAVKKLRKSDFYEKEFEELLKM